MVRRLAFAELVLRARRIRLLVSDVDGVLTDAGVFYSARGEELKRFSIRDGMGVELLRGAGIGCALLTGENSDIVTARASKLQIGLVELGVRDKLERLPKLAERAGVGAHEVAYIGDDVNDLGAIDWASETGLSAAPADASAAVLARVHFVTRASGGHGAFRELCDLILDQRK